MTQRFGVGGALAVKTAVLVVPPIKALPVTITGPRPEGSVSPTSAVPAALVRDEATVSVPPVVVHVIVTPVTGLPN